MSYSLGSIPHAVPLAQLQCVEAAAPLIPIEMLTRVSHLVAGIGRNDGTEEPLKTFSGWL
jgi:hypothetical protein